MSVPLRRAACWVVAVVATHTAGPSAAVGQESTKEASLYAGLGETVEVAEGKLTALLEAFPDDALAWRPMDGVRSVEDVFLHVTADNYFLPVLMGIEAPEATGITGAYATVQAFEGRSLGREALEGELRASFAHLRDAMERTAGDLDREVSLGRTTMTLGALWVQTVTHLHEHLGQAIAYARANGVVPPWSR